MQSGQFRGDLFYRLGMLRIELPPLRERDGDVAELARAFLARSARRYGKTGLRFSEEALDALSRHRWPGNVRELGNLVEQCVILCAEPVIEVEDLPLPVAPASEFGALDFPASDNLPTSLPETERRLLLSALERNRWNVTPGCARRWAFRATPCATGSTSSDCAPDGGWVGQLTRTGPVPPDPVLTPGSRESQKSL